MALPQGRELLYARVKLVTGEVGTLGLYAGQPGYCMITTERVINNIGPADISEVSQRVLNRPAAVELLRRYPSILVVLPETLGD